MQNRGSGGGFDPSKMPLLQNVPNAHAAKELLKGADGFDDFITALTFRSQKQAFAFAKCLYKCRKYHMEEKAREITLKALALCAVDGARAGLYAQTLAGVMVDAFFSKGKRRGDNGNGQKQNNSNA